MELIDVVMKKIYEEVDSLTDSLSHGGAKSYEDYRHVVGVIRGLETVVDIILTLTPKEDDDE